MSGEAALIERCRNGEAAAWDELFDLHYSAAARFIFQVSSDFTPEDVEEICQETFLAVIRNLNSFEGNSQLQTWIFRIAANKARDFLEKTHAAKRGSGIAPVSLQAENPGTGLRLDPPSTLPPPDQLLARREGMEMVSTALEQLGDPCREIIELRYFGDLSYEEISRTLKLNPKTVSSRLSKCLDQLERVATKLFCGENKPFPV